MNSKDKEEKTDLTPSLLEDESRGGDTGEGGIAFQGEVVLSYIPRWLRMEGFTSMVRESIGDTEAKFFVPGRQYRKEFLEVKNHQVAPAEFWEEIDRFRKVDAGAPNEYQWFTLASAGISQSIHPLIHGLRRLRGPYDFYEDSAVKDNSYKDYVRVVEKLGKSLDDAEFLYKKVLIDEELSLNRSHGKAMFKQSFRDNLPHYIDVSDRTLDDVYSALATFVQSRRNQTITRIELEQNIRERVPTSLQPPAQTVRIHTAISDDEKDANRPELPLRWAPFFGGNNHAYPPPSVWNSVLLGELQETKTWILKNRTSRRISLSGNRRLSASLALGSVFSAVAGFSVEMIYRAGEIWATDDHADDDTPSYSLSSTTIASGKTGDRLVVILSIVRDIMEDVKGNLQPLGLQDMPVIHVKGEKPIVSPKQANLVVREIKDLISSSLSSVRATQIDLFFVGPAFLALLLGHRLNATAHVQCYEWIQSGRYVPTCLLF
jgi:hypothetical protein